MLLARTSVWTNSQIGLSLLPYDTSRALQWRHNAHPGVSNHRRLDCLVYRLFKLTLKNPLKLALLAHREGNLPGTGGFLSQRAGNAETISIWWHHHGMMRFMLCCVLWLGCSIYRRVVFSEYVSRMLLRHPVMYFDLTHNFQGCFTGPGAIVWLPQRWSHPVECAKCITWSQWEHGAMITPW